MSANEMTAKVRELKELKAMAEELAQEITAIEDAIKAELTARNTEEMYRAKALYDTYREAKGTDTDSLWDIMSLLSFVYDTARIQGIREERAKRT